MLFILDRAWQSSSDMFQQIAREYAQGLVSSGSRPFDTTTKILNLTSPHHATTTRTPDQKAINETNNMSNVSLSTANPQGPAQPLIYFKFEPFILHVEARTYSHARDLLSVALGCGFKHSGVVTTESRHIVHIRGNLRIDAPVAAVNGGLLVPHGYLRMCVRAANAKLGQVCGDNDGTFPPAL
jgi:tRNA(Phe) wybutosine-synthesizing methylase Tyw3